MNTKEVVVMTIDIKEILLDIMLENGLNQSQFAKLIGVKPSQVSEWLSGKNKPGYDNLRSICINVGVSGDRLLGIEW